MDDDDYRIITSDLPYEIEGFITKDENGFITIVVNSRYPANKQKEFAIHELWHRELRHLDDLETPVRIKEAEVQYQLSNKMIPSAATDRICKENEME